MKSFILETDGKGFWSRKKKKVKIVSIGSSDTYAKYDTNEICLYFSKKSWDIEKDGLIYTDRKFINGFRKYLASKGVPRKITMDIDYTEQGMQGDDYVSLEFGREFKDYMIKKLLEGK